MIFLMNAKYPRANMNTTLLYFRKESLIVCLKLTRETVENCSDTLKVNIKWGNAQWKLILGLHSVDT